MLATIECGFTLKCARDMIRTYSEKGKVFGKIFRKAAFFPNMWSVIRDRGTRYFGRDDI